MNVWRLIVVSTALVPVIAASGCGPKQPEGQYGDTGQCFRQAACIPAGSNGTPGWYT